MKPTIIKQKIGLGIGWRVLHHSFFSLEPDNQYATLEVAKYFTENLFRATNGTFTIDMGFYGTYHQNRAGTYAIYLIRGDFDSGEILAKVKTRSQADAVAQLESFTQAANQGEYANGIEKLLNQMRDLSIAQKLFNLF